MPARDQRMLLALAVGTSVLVVLAALAGHAELIAYAAPLLVVALPLAAGRYVGEERLRQLSSRAVPRRQRAPIVRPALRRPAELVPRGGRLIAHALAERGPPLPALT
ncbi:MAG TPA: hypothetical protein VI122_20715 [Thermoleophilaceae bacterium]|jgi:hypothetical protein